MGFAPLPASHKTPAGGELVVLGAARRGGGGATDWGSGVEQERTGGAAQQKSSYPCPNLFSLQVRNTAPVL